MTIDAKQIALGLEGISKSYPGVEALKNVSFSVSPGEIHALLGENGAGKSTLVGVASGSIAPNEGTIRVFGRTVDAWGPTLAQEAGLAIVYQHPALLPDLTVEENLAIALPGRVPAHRRARKAWMQDQLERVGCRVGLGRRIGELNVAQRHLIELSKALAVDPGILVLDEPTAPLGADSVEQLFDLVRRAAAGNAAVIYISHRLAEVREIADVVTVMRDGEVRGSASIDAITDEEILRLIIGRTVSTAFPAKAASRPRGGAQNGGTPGLVVEGLSGEAFQDVSLTVWPGEIVGLAGIADNGQAQFLRALAGLEAAAGHVRLNDRSLSLGRPRGARRAGVAYLSSDRHHEGLQMTLSVRENSALAALPQLSERGFISRRREAAEVERRSEELDIRTPSIETPVSSLSGGNQQKVVIARALLAHPSLILADEPTQGVDAGARIEIYRILREVADDGIPVLVSSSDTLELEGICDRTVVFSRGHVVASLSGDEVTEERISRSIVTATTHRRADAQDRSASRAEPALGARLRQVAKGDFGPAIVLLFVIFAFGLFTWSENSRVLSAFNITSALTLLSALAFISLGQATVIMTGGIDISVGALAGLIEVIGSFFIVTGKSTGMIVLGFLLMFAAAIIVGGLNGTLIRFLGFTPIAATLAMSIALQGVSLLLRPQQGGYFSAGVTDAITTTVGGIPVAFLVAAALALVLEYCLRKTRWGLALRSAGSSEQAAVRLGVRTDRVVFGAYVISAVLTFVGGVMLMAQIGVGDPTQGLTYTLSSITAVVLGGASLFGARGSYIGALLGAVLVQQILNATVFLGLSQAWQYWLTGGLTLLAAGIYTQARRGGRRAWRPRPLGPARKTGTRVVQSTPEP